MYIHVLYCNIYTLQYVKKNERRTDAPEYRDLGAARNADLGVNQNAGMGAARSLSFNSNLGAARSLHFYYKKTISALYNPP